MAVRAIAIAVVRVRVRFASIAIAVVTVDVAIVETTNAPNGISPVDPLLRKFLEELLNIGGDKSPIRTVASNGH